MDDTLDKMIFFPKGQPGSITFGMERHGKVEEIDSDLWKAMTKSVVLNHMKIAFDSAKDGAGEYPSADLVELKQGQYRYVIAFPEVSKLSDNEYDNAFKAIKARSMEDEFFSAVSGLYASVRGYLGW